MLGVQITFSNEMDSNLTNFCGPTNQRFQLHKNLVDEILIIGSKKTPVLFVKFNVRVDPLGGGVIILIGRKPLKINTFYYIHICM